MQANFIDDCIKSIKSQSYENTEHLILDACSHDSTDEVVGAHAGSYNMRYIREPDAGQADAINKGLSLALGDIVSWLNCDDLFYDSQVVETVVRVFRQNPEVDVVTGGSIYVDPAGNTLRPIPVCDPARFSRELLATHCVLTQPATFWRRNDLRLDQELMYVFDWKFWIDLHNKGFSFLFLPTCFAKYRLHEASKTFRDTAKRKKEVLAVNRYAGASRSSLAWSSCIYSLYHVSERTRIPIIKTAARRLNNMMGKRTKFRVFSQ